MSAKIDHYICELLYDHDCVIITDLGGFIAHYRGAAVNNALHVISPPARKIAFNSSLRHNDGLLASHISREEALSYIEACEVIAGYVENARQKMKNGQKLKLERIGVLYIDKEQNIQFQPDLNANFLIDSFGMTPVHAPLVKREEFLREPVIIHRQPRRSSQRSWKILEVIPAAAVLAFLLMVPPVLDNLNTNLGTMLPFSRINEYIETWSGERKDLKPVVHYPSPFETPPPAELTEKNVMGTPVQPEPVKNEVPVAENEIRREVAPGESHPVTTDNLEIKAGPVSKVAAVESTRSWHVVGGAFRKEKNAAKYVSELIAEGVQASIIGRNEAGFYLVSIFSSPTYSHAVDTLPSLRSNVIKGAWIYRK